MRTEGAILAVIVSGGVLAQGLSTPAGLEFIAGAGTEAINAVGDGFAALDPALRDMLAPVMADWIAGSRDAAIERGVEPIPREVREALTGFVPLEILENVRWRVEAGEVSLEQSLFRMSYTYAVTLDDVILFASLDNAADPKLWAHELFHVMQYRNWGIDGFVARYLSDRAAVEREAWEFRWQWMKATDRVPLP
jgi:Domain of unknown function (DUF4157)